MPHLLFLIVVSAMVGLHWDTVKRKIQYIYEEDATLPVLKGAEGDDSDTEASTDGITRASYLISNILCINPLYTVSLINTVLRFPDTCCTIILIESCMCAYSQLDVKHNKVSY